MYLLSMMNKLNLPKTKSRLQYFVIFNVLSIVHVNGNFVDNQRIDTLAYEYDTFDPFKMSDNNMHMLDFKEYKSHSSIHEGESSSSLVLNRLLINFIDKSLNVTYYELAPGIFVLRNNDTIESSNYARNNNDRLNVLQHLLKFAESHVISVPLSLTESSGRLFFFKGMKKLMWPLLVGIQMVKLTLFAIFLPSIIGSVGKIVSKGLTQVSGFSNQGQQHVDDLEFRDNYENAEGANENDYTYPAADMEPATANSFISQMYQAPGKLNKIDGHKTNYLSNSNNVQMMSVNKETTSKNVNFQVFQDIPNSSLLLTNYDPFYSPLLSRLDAVFQQLSLPAESEFCRQKLICLMYTNPAKYAPYSNLVSAQLSRELNELKKPTSDNPDILRFFKYMKAAKDGQDRSNCDMLHICPSLQDTTNPTMLNTFNDINKLVEARNNK